MKSTSQGTYGRIEQRSEVKRETYKMCRAGGARGLELKTAAIEDILPYSDVEVSYLVLYLLATQGSTDYNAHKSNHLLL